MSDASKHAVALAALKYIEDGCVLGMGTGSTVNCLIDLLGQSSIDLAGAVASSVATQRRLEAIGVDILDLNSTGQLALYIDGADEINDDCELIKGGGGALTREKIVAAASTRFICIAETRKQVIRLGKAFPLPIEVVPMARSLVAREIVKLGGDPEYRHGQTTDNGNVILDVYNLDIPDPVAMEDTLNNLPGVVCNGLFAIRPADLVLLADEQGQVTTMMHT